jgi:hypothetical protein
MAHRQGTSWFRISGLLTVGLAASLALSTSPASADDDDDDEGEANALRYKGSETLALVSVGLNLERCGDVPNFEAVFEGSGIDTAGGLFTVTSSGCQNVATGLVFDLMAVDTYANGDSVNIVADSFYLVLDPQTCVSTNVDPVRYSIDGGTGAYADARGGGKFDFASNDPSCNGVPAPAYVWFRGRIRT